MPPRKLNDNQQAQVLEWLCEGKGNSEIAAGLAQLGINVERQAIDYYRRKWAEQLEEAEALAVDLAKRTGWGCRSKRVRALTVFLDKCMTDLDVYPAGLLVKAGIPKAFLDTLAELRKELGQETPTKLQVEATVASASVGLNDLLGDEDGRKLLAGIADRLCPFNGDAAHAGDEAD